MNFTRRHHSQGKIGPAKVVQRPLSDTASPVPGFSQFLRLCVLCVFALTLAGCVAARKKGRTIHELFEYRIVQPPVGEPVALMTRHEIWRDEWTGGGRAFLADPKASELISNHTNQTALGGSSSLQIGSIESTVNTNGLKIVTDAVSQTASEVISKLIKP